MARRKPTSRPAKPPTPAPDVREVAPLRRAPEIEPSPAVARGVVVAVILVVGVALLARLADPIGVRADSWSEAEVIISGWGYAYSGWLAYAGLPQHQVAPPVDPYFLYANYPVLSNVLYGVLHQLGADAHGLYRLPVLLSSLLAIWLWYRLVTRAVDRTTGMVAAVALGTSFGFLSYADNIHQQAYPMAPQFGAVLCWMTALAPETREQRRWLLGCALCLLLVGLLTVELHPWLMLALAGYVLLFQPAVPRRWVLLLIVLVPLFAGVGVQTLQGRLGSPVPPEDRPSFIDNLYRRSIGFAAAVDTPRDRSGQRVRLATYPGFIAGRFRDFYLLPVWTLPLLMLFAFLGARSLRAPPAQWPAGARLLLLLLVAALGWMGTMMQQTAVHQATMRQLLPFYAALCAVVWTESVRAAVDARNHVALRTVPLIVAAALLVVHGVAAWSNLRMHWDRSYRHPVLLEAGWSEGEDFGALRQLPEGSVILTNHNRLPLIRYWSRRPAYLAPNSVPPGVLSRRTWLELSFNYVRGLYGEHPPRILYLYRVQRPTPENVQRTLASDPLLRLLTTGSFDPAAPDVPRQGAVGFRSGTGTAAPIIARGGNWRVFDLAPVMPQLLQRFGGLPVPRLKDMPAPR